MIELPKHPRLFPCLAGDKVRFVDNTVELHRVLLHGGSARLRFSSEKSASEFLGRAKRLLEMEDEIHNSDI